MSSEFKRRKTIRSCLFCRKRKLKCDQQRPVCSSCKVRNQTCTYVDTTKSTDNSPLLTQQPSPPQLQHLTNETQAIPYVTANILMHEINNLQRQVQQLSSQINSISEARMNVIKTTKTNIKESINPLYEFTYLQVKNSGSRILYGPTSMRTYVIKDKWGFGKKFHQLMIKHKSQKHEENYKKNKLFNRILSKQLAYPLNYGQDNLFLEICNDLPTHEECSSILNRFFDDKNDDIYPMNHILDRHHVIDDYFSKHFVDNFNNLDSSKPHLILASSEQINYYKIAVVLMIFCIAHYKKNIPKSILQFITQVTGLVGSKIYYIERLQFFALRCEYQLYINTDGDNSNLVNLINITSEIAVRMGLNRDIRQLYAGQENIVGTLDSLENLWLHILLLDLESSFHMGKPLCIVATWLNEDAIVEHDLYSSYKIKLIKFLKLARTMMSTITNPTGQPNLQKYCIDLFNFIKNELPSLQMFTEEIKFQSVQFTDVRLFSIALQMFLSFVSLRFAVYNERSILLRDVGIQSCLILLKINILLLKKCFKLDEEYHPNSFSETETSLSPYLCLMLYLTNGLLPRVASVFCPLLYHKISRFNDDSLAKDTKHTNTEWDFSVLSITSERQLSLIKAYDVYCELIAHIADPVSFKLKKILERSHYIHVVLVIEKLYRTIIQKTLEFRSQVESSWIDKDIELVPLAHRRSFKKNTPKEIEENKAPFTTESFGSGEIPKLSLNPISNNNAGNNDSSNSILLNNVYLKHNNASNAIDAMERYGNPDEYLQAITDRFWNEFNIDWSNDLWNTEAIDDILS